MPTEDESEVDGLLRRYAAGTIKPLLIALPLSPGASEPARKVAEFFALVCGLRRAVCDERDVPFSVRWVAGHVDLPRSSVARVLDKLQADGVLVKVGNLPPRGQLYGTALYAPGVVPGAAVRVERRAGVVGDAFEPEAHLPNESLVRVAERAAGPDSVFAAGGRAGFDDHGSDRTGLIGANE